MKQRFIKQGDWQDLLEYVMDLERQIDSMKADKQPESQPETWRAVSSECEVNENGFALHGKNHIFAPLDPCYRLRKVTLANRLSDPGVAFIIERKEP